MHNSPHGRIYNTHTVLRYREHVAHMSHVPAWYNGRSPDRVDGVATNTFLLYVFSSVKDGTQFSQDLRLLRYEMFSPSCNSQVGGVPGWRTNMIQATWKHVKFFLNHNQQTEYIYHLAEYVRCTLPSRERWSLHHFHARGPLIDRHTNPRTRQRLPRPPAPSQSNKQLAWMRYASVSNPCVLRDNHAATSTSSL